MLSKFLILIVAVFLCILGLYLGVVFAVKSICKKSFDEASAIVSAKFDKFFKWLEKFSSQNQPIPSFPVFIGSNGYSIRDEIVNSAFAKLGKYFEIYFFVCAYPFTANVVIYEFKVYNPIYEGMDNRRLCGVAKQVAEGALMEHLHNQGYYNFVIDNFINTTIQADTLRVHIATTTQGFNEIAELRKSPH